MKDAVWCVLLVIAAGNAFEAWFDWYYRKR